MKKTQKIDKKISWLIVGIFAVIFLIANRSGVFEVGQAATATLLAPTNLTATALSASEISLSWTDTNSVEGGTYVERSTDGIVFSQIASLGVNISSYNDSGLASNTLYYYRVRAFKSSTKKTITSPYSNTASATTLDETTPPPPPPPSCTNTKLPATTLLNVLYGIDTMRNLLDVYPASLHPCRFLILIHGGGFTFSGSKEGDFTTVAQWLSGTLGYPVANLEYRGSPGYPTQIQDILTAMRFVETNYGAKEFIIYGHSSGAYLTMLTALAKNSPPTSFGATYPISPIIGAIGTSGSYDYNLLPSAAKSAFLSYAGAYLSDANVIGYADSSDVPVLLVSGDQDKTSPWQSAEALHGVLPNSEYHLIAGACHNCVFKPWDPNTGFTAITAGYIQDYLSGLPQ